MLESKFSNMLNEHIKRKKKKKTKQDDYSAWTHIPLKVKNGNQTY